MSSENTKNASMEPIKIADLELRGELAHRAIMNYARLEGHWYLPHEVFSADQHGWPGDWEGRIILALALHAQVSRREPAWLDEILDQLPARLIENGYFGPVPPEGKINEQQISGHSWLLRGLLECHAWRGDERALRQAERIVERLLLPARGHYRVYPISNQERETTTSWQLSHWQTKTKSHAKTTDTGCAFMMLDGATRAYEVLRRPELAELIEEMIDRYTQLRFAEIGVQTHATLSALRGILRYHGLTGDAQYLAIAREVFALYTSQAWTETYGNYNWFGLPKWTEPCAIIDSFIVAMQLWQRTGDPVYLENAHHIYYNAVAHAQRDNGSFGTDNCTGADDAAFLHPRTFEVYWCCTMRGGEFFGRACESLFFTEGDRIVVPFYADATARLELASGTITLKEASAYPHGDVNRFEVLTTDATADVTIECFAPSWIAADAVWVKRNGETMPHVHEGGFVKIRGRFEKGDVLEFHLPVRTFAQDTINPSSLPGYHTLRHGPMILARAGTEELAVARDARLVREAETAFRVAGTDVVLSPIHSRFDLTKEDSYLQVLFRD